MSNPLFSRGFPLAKWVECMFCSFKADALPVYTHIIKEGNCTHFKQGRRICFGCKYDLEKDGYKLFSHYRKPRKNDQQAVLF